VFSLFKKNTSINLVTSKLDTYYLNQ